MWVDRLVKVIQWLAFFNFAAFFITTHPYLIGIGLYEEAIFLAICGLSLVVFGFWFTVIYIISGKLEFIPPPIKPIVTKAFTKNTILYLYYLYPTINAVIVLNPRILEFIGDLYILIQQLFAFNLLLPLLLLPINIYLNLRGVKK